MSDFEDFNGAIFEGFTSNFQESPIYRVEEKYASAPKSKIFLRAF